MACLLFIYEGELFESERKREKEGGAAAAEERSVSEGPFNKLSDVRF